MSISSRSAQPALHEVIFVIPSCPVCHSHSVQRCHYGKRIGGAVGTVAGALSGAAGSAKGAVEGARVGAAVFSIAGPAATASGAVLGAISGGLVGCVAGIRLGTVLDEELLCHYRCNDCSHHF